MRLVGPFREGMGGCGNRGEAEGGRLCYDCLAEMGQFRTHPGEAIANRGANFDLATQKLGADLVFEHLFASTEEFFRR
ncbi:hypothetical protein GCM10009077_01630 [Roseibium denhamense]